MDDYIQFEGAAQSDNQIQVNSTMQALEIINNNLIIISQQNNLILEHFKKQEAKNDKIKQELIRLRKFEETVNEEYK